VLVYPAYLTAEKGSVEKLASEITVTGETPPAIMIQTEDDSVQVECAVAYYLALKRAGVSAEMHLYPDGGHGYGLRKSEHAVSTWPDRVKDWLASRGLLKKP
jgi:acetyl esterase/lipase